MMMMEAIQSNGSLQIKSPDVRNIYEDICTLVRQIDCRLTEFYIWSTWNLAQVLPKYYNVSKVLE